MIDRAVRLIAVLAMTGLCAGCSGAPGRSAIGQQGDAQTPAAADASHGRSHEITVQSPHAGPARASELSVEQVPITKKEVLLWTVRGVGEDEIVARIEASSTAFRLTAADEQQLRDAGVSESVIRAMRDTSRR